MRQKDITKPIMALLVPAMAALMLTACGDKTGGPPDDEGGEVAGAEKSVSMCDAQGFSDCARDVLVSAGLLEVENDELSRCGFEAAKSHGTPLDQFEVAKQAIRRSCK